MPPAWLWYYKCWTTGVKTAWLAAQSTECTSTSSTRSQRDFHKRCCVRTNSEPSQKGTGILAQASKISNYDLINDVERQQQTAWILAEQSTECSRTSSIRIQRDFRKRWRVRTASTRGTHSDLQQQYLPSRNKEPGYWPRQGGCLIRERVCSTPTYIT